MMNTAFKPAALAIEQLSSAGLGMPSPKLGRKLGSSERPTYTGAEEPPLAEVLSDPIINRLMMRDGIDADHMDALIADIRAHLDATA